MSYGQAVESAAASAGTRGRIAVARLRDGRSAKQGTGTLLAKVRNGYGIPTASVEANQDPVLWVNEGLAKALAAQGFVVEKVESAAMAGDLPTVTGTVTRASGGMYMRTDAFIDADLAIEQGGRSLASVQCEGSAIQMVWTASAAEFGEVFTRAMDDFVTKCTPKLVPPLAASAGR